MTAISDRELVKMCMNDLCAKAGFANCGNLVQRELEFICDSIESRTGVLISLSTMKRLFNGQFARLPQVATLNAIAAFTGYQDWQDYRQAKLRMHGNDDSRQVESDSKPIVRPRHLIFSKYVLLTAILVCSAIALFAFLKLNHSGPGNFKKAKFTMIKTTRSDLPNTVVFNYDVEQVSADSFFIQQSWDKDRRVRIDPKNHTLTDIYYEPGYHVAKLIANETVIRTIDVSIPTDRWFFYARERKTAAIPEYITSRGRHEGALGMMKEEVVSSGIDIGKEYLYLQVNFPTKIEYNSDNYVLKCRARTRQVKNNFCPFLMCEVFCQKNFMFFKATPKGCTSEARAQFGETVLNGKTNDLSLLGSNVSEWQDIEIIVRDKKVSVRMNDMDVLHTSYEEPSGLITGLGFLSNGLAEVDFVSLQTQDGKVIYEDGFNE